MKSRVWMRMRRAENRRDDGRGLGRLDDAIEKFESVGRLCRSSGNTLRDS
jgi:hypothetical protein